MSATIDASELARQTGRWTIVDVRREPDEFEIPGSMRCEGDRLIAGDVPFDRNEPVVLYCGSGNSSTRLARAMRERGYENVRVLEGGYAEWKARGLTRESRK